MDDTRESNTPINFTKGNNMLVFNKVSPSIWDYFSSVELVNPLMNRTLQDK